MRLLLGGGLLLALTTGCAKHALVAAGAGTEPLMMPREDQVPSPSDRRGDRIRTSTSEPEPAMTQPRQEIQQPDGGPARAVAEPDPSDVIDWLLKEKR